MRIAISADGVSVEALRELLAAMSRANRTAETRVGCDGPEKFVVQTPKLTPTQFATVVASLVTVDHRTIAELLSDWSES